MLGYRPMKASPVALVHSPRRTICFPALWLSARPHMPLMSSLSSWSIMWCCASNGSRRLEYSMGRLKPYFHHTSVHGVVRIPTVFPFEWNKWVLQWIKLNCGAITQCLNCPIVTIIRGWKSHESPRRTYSERQWSYHFCGQGRDCAALRNGHHVAAVIANPKDV